MKKTLSGCFKCIALIVALAGFVSCSEVLEQSETGYLPFKSSQNGKWGMIGTDGTVLFEDEFKDEPTSVMNGRFLVKNGNDLWEIYKAEAKPEKVGEEYLQIADFTSYVTPAVKKNERICLIDVNGNVKATLEKANNKNIVSCTAFSYGYAVRETEDDKYGIIDTKGNVVIEAKYDAATPISSGKFCVLTRKNIDEPVTVKILDAGGRNILEMKVGDGQKYTDIDPKMCTDKYLAVCTSVDGEFQWGYLDYSKNVVVKPSSKIRGLGGVSGDNFIYYSGDSYGVMNFDGEVVLRAKYDNLVWGDEDMLIAYDSDSNYSIVNLEGDKLTKEQYLDILPFYDGKHAAVRVDDNSWGFIDKKGEEIKIKNAPDIYYLSQNRACDIVESDFVDIDAIISRIKLDKNGIMGFSIDMMPQQIIKAYNEIEGKTEENFETSPEVNGGRYNLKTTYYSHGLRIESRVEYERCMTEEDGENFVWSKEQPSLIIVQIKGEILNDKLDILYKKVAAIVKSYGKVMRENSRAVVVKQSEEQGWIVVCDKADGVCLGINNNGLFQDEKINRYEKCGETTREYIKSSREMKRTEDYSEVDSVDNY